jgi:hypothetical protein
MDHITYRTNDPTRWGNGHGSDLSAPQIDMNFWALFSLIQSLQDHQNVAGVISNISVQGSNLFITLGDGTVFGPFTLPTAHWNFRQDGWQPNTLYNAFDVFMYQGGLYLVIFGHTSAATFNTNANDGQVHGFYKLLLGPGPYDVGMFYSDAIPDSGSVLLMHVAARSFWLPAGLTDSVATLRVAATDELLLPIYKNDTLIGAILFGGSDADVQSDGMEFGRFVFTAAVQFNYRDRLIIPPPSSSHGPDASAAGLAVTLAGHIGIFAP